jgi:hypothetical protein
MLVRLVGKYGVHVLTEPILQNFRAIDLPRIAKCRPLRDCGHVTSSCLEIILRQLTIDGD